ICSIFIVFRSSAHSWFFANFSHRHSGSIELEQLAIVFIPYIFSPSCWQNSQLMTVLLGPPTTRRNFHSRVVRLTQICNRIAKYRKQEKDKSNNLSDIIAYYC